MEVHTCIFTRPKIEKRKLCLTFLSAVAQKTSVREEEHILVNLKGRGGAWSKTKRGTLSSTPLVTGTFLSESLKTFVVDCSPFRLFPSACQLLPMFSPTKVALVFTLFNQPKASSQGQACF